MPRRESRTATTRNGTRAFSRSERMRVRASLVWPSWVWLSTYLSICVFGVVWKKDGRRIHGVGARMGECCGSGGLSRGVVEEVPRWVCFIFF